MEKSGIRHCGTMTIETKRLVLRRLRVDDAGAMFKNWASDPDVTAFLRWPPHQNVDLTELLLSKWEEQYEKDDYYQWGIELKEISEVIGTISVISINPEIEECAIGYCIGKAWWHRGIMTEALNAIIRFLFEVVEFNRIMARHDVRNPHSGAVMRNCGMQFEGLLRSASRNNQGICDVGQYAILRSDYDKNPDEGRGLK